MFKRMKATLALTLALTLCLAACQPTTAQPSQSTPLPTQSQPPQKGGVTFVPGTYTIDTNGHNTPFQIQVTFDEKSITAIELGENEETPGVGDVAMEAMRSAILEHQSLNVDTTSGATISGLFLRNAVKEAVAAAGGDPDQMQTPTQAEDTAPLPDETVDVVVVGSGGAGMAAAANAAELGMSVLLVEQLGILGGSSGRAALIFDYDPETAYTKLSRPFASDYEEAMYNDEYVHNFSNEILNNYHWLEEKGVKFSTTGERNGVNIIRGLAGHLDTAGVEYRLNTKAMEIVMDGGRAVGITAQAPNGTTYTIHADSVIIATGGFFAGKEMVKQYLPQYADLPTDISMGADGSGMQMVEAVGGVLSQMDAAGTHAVCGLYNGVSRSLTLPCNTSGCIVVNSAGERFANEAVGHAPLGAAVRAQDGDVFAILDQAIMDRPEIKNDHGLSNILAMYEVADTLEELAQKLGINPAGLVKTVEEYGSYVQSGEDLAFGKSKDILTSDFSSGPYYGVKAVSETHTNYGGVVTDIYSRALKADGTPIPGLYAAGEVARFLDAGRAPFTTSIHMGRVAAQTALADSAQ